MTLELVSPGYFAADGYPNANDTNNVALQGNLIKITFPLATDKTKYDNSLNSITYQIRYTSQPIHCGGTQAAAYIFTDTADYSSTTAWVNITNLISETETTASSRVTLPQFSTDVTIYYEIRAIDEVNPTDGAIIKSAKFFAIVNKPSTLNISDVKWFNTNGDVVVTGSILDNGFSKPKTIINSTQWDNYRRGVSSIIGDIPFSYWYEYGLSGELTSGIVSVNYPASNFTYGAYGLPTDIYLVIPNTGQFNAANSYSLKFYLFGNEVGLSATSETNLLYTSEYVNPYTKEITLVAQLPQLKLKKSGISVNIPRGNTASTGGAMISRTYESRDSLALYDYHVDAGETVPANEPSIGFYDTDNVRRAAIFNRNNDVYIQRGEEIEQEIAVGMVIGGNGPFYAKNGIINIGSITQGKTTITDLSSQVDGTNVVFQLETRAPGVISLFYNGDRLMRDMDYAYDGEFEIIFITQVPKVGDIIQLVSSSQNEETAVYTKEYDLSSQVDGVKTSFTLPETPAGMVSVFYNGVFMKETTDYTLNGTTLVTVGFIPIGGDTLVLLTDLVISDVAEKPVVLYDLTPQVADNNKNFILTEKITSTHMLFYNGIFQQWGVDYEYDYNYLITTLTFTPKPGDFLSVMYGEGVVVGNMTTEVYDTNENGIVDNAERLDGNTVNDLVDLFYPLGTWYTTAHPAFDPNEQWPGTTWVYYFDYSTESMHLWLRTV